MPDTVINPATGAPYYAGTVDDIKKQVRLLSLRGGRAAPPSVSDEMILYYMGLAESLINGVLQEYYFTPVRQYRHAMPGGDTVLVYPAQVVSIAQRYTAALLIEAEFQNIDPNSAGDLGSRFSDECKQMLHSLTSYNVRLPGQTQKSGWGRTALPTMQPGLPPEQTW